MATSDDHARWIGPPVKRPHTTEPVSWWIAFAQGDRRDGEYMQAAEARVPKQTDQVQLKEWVGAA